MLVAVQDEASQYRGQAETELRKLGASSTRLGYRWSHALAGYSGPGRPSWVQEVMRKSGKGPSVLMVEIPLHFQYKATGREAPNQVDFSLIYCQAVS